MENPELGDHDRVFCPELRGVGGGGARLRNAEDLLWATAEYYEAFSIRRASVRRGRRTFVGCADFSRGIDVAGKVRIGGKSSRRVGIQEDCREMGRVVFEREIEEVVGVQTVEGGMMTSGKGRGFARASALAAFASLLAFAPRAAAWDESAYDKLSIGQTTPQETFALLGRPGRAGSPMFHRKIDRWSYFSTKWGIFPGQSLTLDFVGDKLARKERHPDGVEERKGFVLEGGLSASSARTTGTRRLSGAENGFALAYGWAPTQRLALLLNVFGNLGHGREQQAGGVGLRIFPVMPWYIQADALPYMRELVHAPPAQDYFVSGNGYAVRTGYEFGWFRKMAVAPEVFMMKTHSWRLGTDAPAGAKEDLRSTVWGGLLKIVWYP